MVVPSQRAAPIGGEARALEKTEHDALAVLHCLLAREERRIDIGLMQLNFRSPFRLHGHRHATEMGLVRDTQCRLERLQGEGLSDAASRSQGPPHSCAVYACFHNDDQAAGGEPRVVALGPIGAAMDSDIDRHKAVAKLLSYLELCDYVVENKPSPSPAWDILALLTCVQLVYEILAPGAT